MPGDPLPDDELGRHLERRVSAGPLTTDERADVIRAARLEATATRRSRWVPRLATAAVAVVLVVFVVVGTRILPLPAEAIPPPTSIAAGSARPSASPMATAGDSPADPRSLHVYSAQELSDMIGDQDRVNETVLARADIQLIRTGPIRCQPPAPCRSAFLADVNGKNVVSLTWSEVAQHQGDSYGGRWWATVGFISGSAPYAFRLHDDSVELLGPVSLMSDNSAFDLPGVRALDDLEVSDVVYPVDGWLSQATGCPPGPGDGWGQSPQPPTMDGYCGGSWISGTEAAATPVNPFDSRGLNAPFGSYDEFAVNPHYPPDRVSYGEARRAIYLVRNVGCPYEESENGRCPVWRIVGRLDAGDGQVAVPGST